MSENQVIRFLRIARGLQDALERRPAGGYSLLDFSSPSDYNVLRRFCLNCSTRNNFIGGPSGIWADVVEVLRREGVDSDAFLNEFRKRLSESDHNCCRVLDSEHVLEWIAEHIS